MFKLYPRYELTDGLLQALVATLTYPVVRPAHQSLVELTLRRSQSLPLWDILHSHSSKRLCIEINPSECNEVNKIPEQIYDT